MDGTPLRHYIDGTISTHTFKYMPFVDHNNIKKISISFESLFNNDGKDSEDTVYFYELIYFYMENPSDTNGIHTYRNTYLKKTSLVHIEIDSFIAYNCFFCDDTVISNVTF